MSNLIEKHISEVDGDILILVSSDTVLFATEIIKNYKNINIIEVNDFSLACTFPEKTYSLIICFGCNNKQTHLLYSIANPYKEKGIPVVFGNSQRGLFFSSPNWRDVDLNMSGFFFLASQYLRQLDAKGSYAEFGVFDGRSMTLAYHSLKNSVDKFYGFDSFEGIIGTDENESRLYPEGSFYANIETFWHNMRVSGVNEKRIVPIQGAFQETLVGNDLNNIQQYSICYIDSDIYEAAYLVLNYIKPHLLPGALIVFDEYHSFGADPNRGERKAVREWLLENPDVSLELYRNFTAFSAAFIFHKNE